MTTRIVNNLPKPNAVFKGIEMGQFFLDGDGDLCIRVGRLDTPNNALYLEGGGLFDASADDTAIPVKVTISIDGYEK